MPYVHSTPGDLVSYWHICLTESTVLDRDEILSLIERRLTECGISAAAASRAAVGNHYLIRNLQTGRVRWPSVEHLDALCEVLGLEFHVGLPRGESRSEQPRQEESGAESEELSPAEELGRAIRAVIRLAEVAGVAPIPDDIRQLARDRFALPSGDPLAHLAGLLSALDKPLAEVLYEVIDAYFDRPHFPARVRDPFDDREARRARRPNLGPHPKRERRSRTPRRRALRAVFWAWWPTVGSPRGTGPLSPVSISLAEGDTALAEMVSVLLDAYEAGTDAARRSLCAEFWRWWLTDPTSDYRAAVERPAPSVKPTAA